MRLGEILFFPIFFSLFSVKNREIDGNEGI